MVYNYYCAIAETFRSDIIKELMFVKAFAGEKISGGTCMEGYDFQCQKINQKIIELEKELLRIAPEPIKKLYQEIEYLVQFEHELLKSC